MNQLLRNLEFKVYAPNFEKSVTKDGKRKIVGYASTFGNLDRQGEIISREALEGARNDMLNNKTIFFNHNHSDLPIGRCVDCILDDKGLLITVEVSKAGFCDDVWTLIEEGSLNSFSIGGVVLDGHDERDDEGKSYHVIDKLNILETSIVGLPANPLARFELSKSLSFNSAIAEQIKLKEGSIKMAEQDKKEVVKVDEPLEEVTKVETEASEKVSEETKKEEAKEKPAEEKKEAVKEEAKVEESVKIEVDVSLVGEAEKVEDEVTVDSKAVEKPKEEAKVEDSKESKEEVVEKPAEAVKEEAVVEAEEVVSVPEPHAEEGIVEKSEETSPEKTEKEEVKVEEEEKPAEKSTEEKILDALALIIEKLSAMGKKEIEEKKEVLEAEDEKARGDGQGQGGPRQGDGGATMCVCPNCKKEFAHVKGVPCNEQKCPDCDVALVGKSEEIEEEKKETKTVEEVVVEKNEEVKTEEKVEKKEEEPKRKSLAVVVPSPYEEDETEKKPEEVNKTTDSGWNKLFFGK